MADHRATRPAAFWLAVAALALAACGGGAAPSRPSPAEPAEVASSTPGASVSPTEPTGSAESTKPAEPDWRPLVTRLLRANRDVARHPSYRAVRQFCLPRSECSAQSNNTVAFMLERGVHAEGLPSFRVDSVEYQGTLDDVPLEQALEITFIVRMTFLRYGDGRLVRADGTLHSVIDADKSIKVGRQYSRSVSLGRVTTDSPWLLSSSGDLG